MISQGIIEVDVHGMNQYQTQVKIQSVLKKAPKGTYAIRVIHGYRGGTTLKDMIRKTYRTHPRVLRVEVTMNPGITELILKNL